MAGMLFITCPEADHRLVNRALWHLKDLQYDSGDRFHIVATRDPEDISDAESAYEKEPDEAGSLREDSFSPQENVWAGATLADVEKFVLALEYRENSDHKLNKSIYVVIDAEGANDQTCIVGDRKYEPEGGESPDDGIPPEWRHESKFDKFRCPWEEAYTIWCNLDIANMDFTDFADQEAGPDRDGWWQYCSVNDGPDLSDENLAKREAEIKKLKDSGNA